MNNKILGTIALVGAPFLLVDFIVNTGDNKEMYQHTVMSGIFNILYITGWICSIIGLYRIKAMGTSLAAKIIAAIQLLFLTLAEGWNIYEAVSPGANTPLYLFLDMFWPISNLFMLVTAFAIIFGKRLRGGNRFIPLAVSLWLPLSMLGIAVSGQSKLLSSFSGIYSCIAWVLMAFVVYTSGNSKISYLRLI